MHSAEIVKALAKKLMKAAPRFMNWINFSLVLVRVSAALEIVSFDVKIILFHFF